MRKSNLLVVIFAMMIATPAIDAQESAVEYSEAIPMVDHRATVDMSSVIAADAYDGSSSCDTACGDNGCRYCGVGPLGRWKCKQQQKWWGFPEEFHEQPLGCATNGILQAQAMRGEQARLTLYHYDFVRGGSTLHARGRARLAQLAALAQQRGGVITIQPMHAELDAQRLLSVQTMAADSLHLHPHQIVVAPPIAAGLRGEEAAIIHRNHLQTTTDYGVRTFNFGSFSSQGRGSSTSGTR